VRADGDADHHPEVQEKHADMLDRLHDIYDM
jgi:hypothetical protein